MTAAAVIIDAATGVIKRKVMTNPAMLANQVAAGEAMFAILDDDGRAIDDSNVIVSATGRWAAKAGAPEGLTLPTTTIEYVAV